MVNGCLVTAVQRHKGEFELFILIMLHLTVVVLVAVHRVDGAGKESSVRQKVRFHEAANIGIFGKFLLLVITGIFSILYSHSVS